MGLRFFFVPLVIGSFGFIRKEAASLIWGSSFILLFLILMLLSIIQVLFLRSSFYRNKPAFPIPASVTAKHPFSVPLEAYLPFLLPGFRCIWKTELFWKPGERSFRTVSTLRSGDRRYEVLFPKVLRGVYKGESGRIIIEDIFGITKFVIFKGNEISLTVFPDITGNGIENDRTHNGGENSSVKFERTRTDELLEVRKYYPGDDARRINWKMFASSGQLFLRIGEEIPPPSGKITVILNSESKDIGKLKNHSLYIDTIIQYYLSYVFSLYEKGFKVLVFYPFVNEPIEFEPDKPDSLLSGMAALTVSSGLSSNEKESSFVYFSYPGSESTKKLCNSKQGGIRVFIKSLPDIERPSLFKTLFFRDESSLISLRDFPKYERIQKETNKDILYLKKHGKGRINGEIF